MRVLMLPHVTRLGDGTHGIARVVEGYFRHLPDFGVEMAEPNATSYDVKAVHAGMTAGDCTVCHCHGMYWTADYDAAEWEYKTNAKVVDAVRHAREVTVPSAWVAETFQRDMRFTPHVVPHGVEWEEWQHGEPCGGYVLYNKNRQGDVCDVGPLAWLAARFPDARFVSTQLAGDLPNVSHIGVVPPPEMKRHVQGAAVFLATTKETFGIGTLEAMASGVPVLGYAHGGTLDLVRHGVNGYLAGPGNLEDLAEGLDYCLKHREVLGGNGREMARAWTWEAACKKVAEVYRLSLAEQPPTVAVVIPTYDYGEFVGNAVASAVAQTYPLLTDIVVVDDGTDDGGLTERIVKGWAEADGRVRYLKQSNAGVAVARNRGIAAVGAKYVCCLDADDLIASDFLARLVPAIEADRSLGVVYAGMMLHYADGKSETGFVRECDFDEHLIGIDERGYSHNQVPTCCLFRREAWERLGGYRQRYAPSGCGTEDAEFWLRMGAYGWGIKQASKEPLFHYTMGGRTSREGHETVEYTRWHPWARDRLHPFASIATPHKHSHPVRQYDEPTVSVVIPVGPGHEDDVVNALDSLEAQTFRKWEAILVNDTGKAGAFGNLVRSYPYVKFLDTLPTQTQTSKVEPKGAAIARNVGARAARALLLLFLDADDWLYPECLDLMVRAASDFDWNVAVYSDYVRLSVIDGDLAESLRRKGRLLDYREDGHAVSLSHAFDYDEARALRQPDAQDPYIWNLISTLIPTAWFHELGGFDEEMESFEDWDLWLRAAQLRKPFVRIPQPLVVYRMYSGNRREEGAQIAPYLINYMRAKYGLSPAFE